MIVVCDEETIFNEIQKNGGKAVLSTKEYESGTDRIAEIATTIDADIIVNVQGDEPFISKDALEKVIALFNNSMVDVGSLILPGAFECLGRFGVPVFNYACSFF